MTSAIVTSTYRYKRPPRKRAKAGHQGAGDRHHRPEDAQGEAPPLANGQR
jgi:hypothetical protein